MKDKRLIWIQKLRVPNTPDFYIAKTRPGGDCGSDHELLIAKFRLIRRKLSDLNFFVYEKRVNYI